MKADMTLKPNRTRGWRLGLGNLLSRENRKWWGTSRWWVQTLVWALITNGVLVLLLFLTPFVAENFKDVDASELSSLPGGVEAFFSLAGLALPIGVIVLVQGSIITEKELGTAEWVLSKPVSRTAFFLAKFLAHSLGILMTLVIFQSALAYGLIWIKEGVPLPPLGFLRGAGVLGLTLLFYLSLTLMLEVLSDRRGMVLGIALGNALGGMLLVNLFPGLSLVTPFALANLAPLIVNGGAPAGLPVWMPLTATGLFSLIFIIIALRRFNKKPL
jgi:ABC-2 type transport system permease protein